MGCVCVCVGVCVCVLRREGVSAGALGCVCFNMCGGNQAQSLLLLLPRPARLEKTVAACSDAALQSRAEKKRHEERQVIIEEAAQWLLLLAAAW